MKRDMDLIRLLLHQAEGEEEVALDQHTGEQILYHKGLLIERGLAQGNVLPGDDRIMAVHIERLTWEGHEFLDAIRSDTVWNKVKQKFGAELNKLAFSLIQAEALSIAKNLFP